MPRILPVLVGLFTWLSLSATSSLQAQGTPTAPKILPLQWTHAYDLACRKFGEDDFSKETQKFGVEGFRDTNNDLGIYVCQTGAMALAPNFESLKVPVESKQPEWRTGLDIPARKAGEKEFTSDTVVHSMEVFRDPQTGNWIYMTENGLIAACAAPGRIAGPATSPPQWRHSFDLHVRKGGVKDWKDAATIGIEVFRDPNTGNLIYISDTGAIAVIPETPDTQKGNKAPEWLHGLDLACRKSNETSFTKDTRKFGIEVFRDENNGNLIFLCETGSLAVTPGSKTLKAPTQNVKEPIWTHGVNLKARSVGEREFSDKTKVWGGEIFRDDNLAVTIALSETGTISALRKE